MARNIDRRVARTQAAMRGALIRLLERKAYTDITVQEILDEADIGRSTFYAHCSGKDQLLRLSFRLLQSELVAAVPSADDKGDKPLPFSLPLIQHLAEHRDLYAAFADKPGSELLYGELNQLVLKLARRDLDTLPRNGIPLEVTQHFVAGAFTALIAQWLKGKARVAPEILDAQFQQLVRAGVGIREAASI